MIQIDGLAYRQFERAVKSGRLKFLARQLGRNAMELREFYSGLPSTTPAVQAEIFYNVRTAVPAFEFLHRKSGEAFRMFDPEPSATIEKELEVNGSKPLLAGGRTYSNIYRAGATDSHYCSQDLARRELGKMIFSARWIIITLAHLPVIGRMIFLSMVEVLLAAGDFFRGLFVDENLWRELLTIPARVFIGIMLREYIRFRVLLDIEEGARVIHANFLGYDEQAHRRGPSSAFAHWALRGIDRAIRDIHRAANRAESCDYEFIIYSDHGQEETDPYPKRHGRLLETALAEVFSTGPWSECKVVAATSGKRYAGESGSKFSRARRTKEGEILVAAMGPVGHVYFPQPASAAELEQSARAIVANAGVPLVLWRDGAIVRAANANGLFELPRDTAEVVGPHPFIAELSRDFPALVCHENAGDLVLSGWNPHGKPISFPPENGGHAGPGPDETRGFLLLPESLSHEAAILKSDKEPVRGSDLYRLVHDFLDEERPVAKRVRTVPRADHCLRVMTYNIHSCVGIDGRLRPERIARAINRFHPDIVAVQEVDAHRARSGRFHQAEWLAAHLEFQHVFRSMLEEEEEKYGIAVFSSLPFDTMRMDLLTKAGGRSVLAEARGAIWLKIDVGGHPLHFINTHFGLKADERNRQAAELLSERWIGGIPDDEAVILCGDFNATARSVAMQRLAATMQEVGFAPGQGRRAATFPSIRPVLRLDHIFTSQHLRVGKVVVPRDLPVAIASDHLPLIADLEWRSEG